MLYALLCLLALPACTTVRQTEAQTTKQHSENASGEEIVFLHFTMRTDTLTHHDSVELTKTHIAQGRLKQENVPTEQPPPPNHLVLTALDTQQQPVQQVYLEHPLRKTVEYIGEDSTFHTQHVHLSTATFFIRLRYSPSLTALRVEEYTETKALQLVGTIPLHHIHSHR